MRPAISSAICALLLAAAASADFKYTMTSTSGGALGSNPGMQMFAGGDSTVYIHGKQMRIDRRQKIRIIDVNAEQVIEIDPQAKTYWVMTFDQLRERTRQRIEEAKQRFPEFDKAARAQRKSAAESAAAGVSIGDFTPKPTGATQMIGKWMATEFVIESKPAFATYPTSAADKAKAASSAADSQGSMTTSTDIWTTDQIDGSELRGFIESLSSDPEIAGMVMGSLASPFGMGELLGASNTLTGFPVKTVFRTLVSQTPPPAPTTGTEPSVSAPAQTQTVELMRIERTVADASNAPLDPALFAIPAQYQKVAPPDNPDMF